MFSIDHRGFGGFRHCSVLHVGGIQTGSQGDGHSVIWPMSRFMAHSATIRNTSGRSSRSPALDAGLMRAMASAMPPRGLRSACGLAALAARVVKRWGRSARRPPGQREFDHVGIGRRAAGLIFGPPARLALAANQVGCKMMSGG